MCTPRVSTATRHCTAALCARHCRYPPLVLHQALFSGSKSVVQEANTFPRNLKGNLHGLPLLATHRASPGSPPTPATLLLLTPANFLWGWGIE